MACSMSVVNSRFIQRINTKLLMRCVR